METKQKNFLKRQFVKGYEPNEEELNEMKEKMELKGRLSESFWIC